MTLSRNDMLCDFAMRFRLDGDLLRCVACKRGHIASKENEDFVHAPSCRLKRAGGRPWAELQAIMLSPDPATNRSTP